MKSKIPELRRSLRNDAPLRPDRTFVLYWMTSARRLSHNFALDRAIELARELAKPLVILEALRVDHPWACRRFHQFVLEGMQAQADAAARAPVTYYPYVERTPGEGRGLLDAFARSAAAIVTDAYPTFFLPRMTAAAASLLDVRLEAVDSNGLLPLAASPQAFPTAHAFRRHLQRTLPAHLLERPRPRPLVRLELPRLPALPREVEDRWPSAPLGAIDDLLDALPIDRAIHPVPYAGGADEGSRRLRQFVAEALPSYAERRNDPSEDATSGLSPYLHFGHVSAHAVADAVLSAEGWDPTRLSSRRDGSREGWWGVSPSAEGFLDQLVTWRELGYHFAHHREDHARWESLPGWARETLDKHALDPRPHAYDSTTLEAARTHDPIWNAAQRQLREEGRIQNYLRMLWGKKILEWSRSPHEALAILIELNDKYAVDGRDPNSYSGIFWTLGRHDRPWGPERPIFGMVRYMSSESTRRKLRLGPYLERWREPSAQIGLPL